MSKARDFKFGVLIERRSFKPESEKVGQKGHGLRNVSYYYKFVTPLYLWSGKARVFEFGVQIDRQPRTNKCKSTSIGAWPTSREILLQFLDPSVFLECVTLVKL